MRSIAIALKRQQLRKAYPSGVHISNVIQRGPDTFYVTLTNLKNGHSFEPIEVTQYLGILSATLQRDALVAGFQEAGVFVKEGFLSSMERLALQ